MSSFNYAQYQDAIAKAQTAGGSNSSTKVGFFKLKDDGDEALVRFNVADLNNDVYFATVHSVQADGRWMKVSCLNLLGQYSNNTCPLCTLAADGTSVGKAIKRTYVPMLVAYRDPATGNFSAPIPVIWERPAGFSRELLTMLKDYGDLRQVMFKVTRNGKAGDMKTTYSISYAVPTVFKPELIPMDFSGFNGFKINKHSYWEKSAEDLAYFVQNRSFPEAPKAPMPTDADAPRYTATPATTGYAPQTTQAATTPVDEDLPFTMDEPAVVPPTQVPTASTEAATAAQQSPVNATRPTRNFSGPTFSF